MKKEFTYKYGIGQIVYINVPGGKCLRIVDVSYSLMQGVEYLTIDELGVRETYNSKEITHEQIFENMTS